jgi:hypothetical protein
VAKPESTELVNFRAGVVSVDFTKVSMFKKNIFWVTDTQAKCVSASPFWEKWSTSNKVNSAKSQLAEKSTRGINDQSADAFGS